MGYTNKIHPITPEVLTRSQEKFGRTQNISEFGISKISPVETYSIRIETINKTLAEELNNHKYIDLGLSVHWADRNFASAIIYL